MNDERRGFFVVLLSSLFAMVANLFGKKSDPTIADQNRNCRMIPFVSDIAFSDTGIEITKGVMVVGADGRIKTVTVNTVPDIAKTVCCEELYLTGDIDSKLAQIMDCSQG